MGKEHVWRRPREGGNRLEAPSSNRHSRRLGAPGNSQTGNELRRPSRRSQEFATLWRTNEGIMSSLRQYERATAE